MSERNTIYVENCQVLEHRSFSGNQYIITLQTERIAKETKPGQFVHIRCSDELLMRRPISVMTINQQNGMLELLYKTIGRGTTELAKRTVGEHLSVMGPIGKAFSLDDTKTHPIFIGGGVGMPPMIALAQHIKNNPLYQPLVILGSEVGFPFQPELSHINADWASKNATHTMGLMEQWGIACRLCSLNGEQGVFKGYVTDLTRRYLDQLDEDTLQQTMLFSCGPEPMLVAVVELARAYQLPVQVSLEEYMACAVGGCAGCTVLTTNNHIKQMKRVCVDGPVFDGYDVF